MSRHWVRVSRRAKGWMEVDGCKHGIHPDYCSMCNPEPGSLWISGAKLEQKPTYNRGWCEITENLIEKKFHGAVKIPEWKVRDIEFGEPDDEFPMPEGDMALFDDREHGEAWIGMAVHCQEMSGLERMINEDCYQGSRVSHPRLDLSDGKVFWQREEWLMRKLSCDIITARKLIEAWKFMDYNTDIVMKSIDGIKKHGLHLGFCKTVNWACAMAEVDLPDEENEREFEEVIAMGKEEQKYQEYLQEKEDEREYRIPNNPFKWIPLGDVEDEQVPWIMRQPAWVREDIESLSRINDIDELTKIGKKAYEGKERFTPDQSGVFWTQYNIRKKVLMRRLEPNFNKLIEFVKTTDKKMGWLGKYLWNLQKEEKLKLANPQWKAVWEVWNLRKEKSGPQQPKRLEDCPAFEDNPEIDEYAMMMDTLKKMEEEAYTEIP